MAFRQPARAPRQLYVSQPNQEEYASTPPSNISDRVEESQEWILFYPSQAASATTGARTDRTPRTAGLSRISDFGSLATRSGQPTESSIDDAVTEDGELDSLDEGLQAFREPSTYRSSSNQGHGAVLPTHDGLGTFPPSSTPVQDQLWQHERFNPKRKYEGFHRRRSSLQKRLDTIEELDLQISEEKRLRIEEWRMEQSQALLNEIEKETRRRERNSPAKQQHSGVIMLGVGNDLLGTTPKQSDVIGGPVLETEVEPFWRRVARRFIRDVIGIDEPLLSVIVGETLPEDICAIADLVGGPECGPLPDQKSCADESWPDRLLHRIARELGLLVNKLSPHPGAFTRTPSSLPPDYAGIPISDHSSGKSDSQRHDKDSGPGFTLLFSPTIQDPSHNSSWGLEDEPSRQLDGAWAEADNAEMLRREREYWERELDIKMVFRFLKSRFSSNAGTRRQDTSEQPTTMTREDPTRRADAIRRHHPLVARAHQPSIARLRRKSSLRSLKRSTSSCATESVRGGHRPSLARSGSSQNYWDLGGSIGSGSAVASGGMMGTWGEV
jgi:hypothetical protein